MVKASVPLVPRSRIEPTLPMPAERARPAPGAAYFRNDKSPFLFGWRPSLREQSEDVRAAWQTAAARAVDQMQNSGIIAGIIEHSTACIVGPRLMLSLSPDAKALGWDNTTARTWAEMVENRWAIRGRKAENCDAGARMTDGMMQQLAYLSWLVFGEVVALLPMIARPGSLGMTKVLMLPPKRLSQKTSPFERISQGVRIDEYGAPLSYLIERTNTFGFKDEVEIRARDGDGRRYVIHVFDPSFAGTTRGISPLAPALKVMQQIDQAFDTTITTYVLQTIFAASIKTSLQGQTAFEGLLTERDQGKGNMLEAFGELKTDWYDGAKIDLMQHGRIAHLFPNDELTFHEAKHPNQTLDMLVSWLYREIARCAGLTYESATGDYRNSSYSASRLGIEVEWGTVTKRRSNIVVPFADAVFDAWLEEEVGTGRIGYAGGFDAFLMQRDFATARTWTGPPKPQPDDLKTARAQETKKAVGIGSLASMNAEYGIYWKDNMEQRAREREYALSLGLPDPYPPEPPPSAGNKDGGDPQDEPPAKQQAA